ncbi:MAG TPA: chemoreceptor glutamine deamidase CheD [Burkholderiales bacterium]|nr:chemoreceptor glutamine deamidase CheD [Burkholderiales bacterium]
MNVPPRPTRGNIRLPEEADGVPRVTIHIGGVRASPEPLLLDTVLGSCIATCLYDPSSGVGGMNHFMLPEGGTGPVGESARYGVHAMEVLLNDLLKEGGRRGRLQAKIFGGGNVLKGFTVSNVGEQNVRFVREYLQREGIRVVGEDLLGKLPRKVAYYPVTGKAMVKRLPPVQVVEIGRMETLYRDRLRETPVVHGPVEVFTS